MLSDDEELLKELGLVGELRELWLQGPKTFTSSRYVGLSAPIEVQPSAAAGEAIHIVRSRQALRRQRVEGLIVEPSWEWLADAEAGETWVAELIFSQRNPAADNGDLVVVSRHLAFLQAGGFTPADLVARLSAQLGGDTGSVTFEGIGESSTLGPLDNLEEDVLEILEVTVFSPDARELLLSEVEYFHNADADHCTA